MGIRQVYTWGLFATAANSRIDTWQAHWQLSWIWGRIKHDKTTAMVRSRYELVFWKDGYFAFSQASSLIIFALHHLWYLCKRQKLGLKKLRLQFQLYACFSFAGPSFDQRSWFESKPCCGCCMTSFDSFTNWARAGTDIDRNMCACVVCRWMSQ